MRCKRCSRRAVINLRSYRLPLCEEHFLERFVATVRRAIKEYRLLSREDRILVAVSGGKDSLALWDVLLRLGYRADGVYIDLGIRRENYSEISKRKSLAFAEQRGAELTVVDLREEYGRSVPGLARRSTRSTCGVCGIVKRHIMDSVALRGNYTVLATGHNLDDEASVLLANLLRWQTELLARQAPRLEAWHPKLRPKVKPLCLLTERETAAYAVLRGIDYVHELECPYSERATTITMKEALNRIEERSPGTKLYFYREFLKRRELFRPPQRAEEAGECEVCGFPTTSRRCAFCRLVEGQPSRQGGNQNNKKEGE
ncbi:MAG: TIGR00269 family protein [Euryarchaeota archaeon]|nr:TIGR00269 family protein [Euryarchaeota archaeon]